MPIETDLFNGGASQSDTTIGRYYLNQYTMTVVDNRGNIVHGFIAYGTDSGQRDGNIDRILLNNDWYYLKKSN